MEEIRPQGTRARALVPFMAGLCALGLVVLVLSLAIRLPSRTEGFGGTLFAAGGLGVVYLTLWLRNARLLVGSGLIGQRNLLGHASTIQASDVGRLVIASVVYSKSSTPQRALYVMSLQGRLLMALNVQAWGEDAIGKIVEASGRNLEYRDGPVSSRDFKAEFPNAVSWWAMHPMVVGGGIVVVAFVLALGIPIAWALMSRGG